MAYATGSGTLEQMLAAYATFALANGGFTAPSDPGNRNYWRILMWPSPLNAITATGIDFKDNAGTSVGVPDTFLSNGSGSFASWAADSLNGGPDWVGGFWSVAVNVKQVTIDFNSTNHCFGNFQLEWSDDGVSWNVYTVFNTRGIDGIGSSFTFIQDNNYWPLTIDDEGIWAVGTYPASQDNTVTGKTEYLVGGGSRPIDVAYLGFNFGNQYACMTREEFDRGMDIQIPSDQLVAEWHFFADTTVAKYAHCAFRMTWEGRPVWRHLFMGEIDRRGMTHNGVQFASAEIYGFYASLPDTSLHRLKSWHLQMPFSGRGILGQETTEISATQWRFKSGINYPALDNAAWPDRNDDHDFTLLFPILGNDNHDDVSQDQADRINGRSLQLAALPWISDVHPVSGAATLTSLPFIIREGELSSDNAMYLGEFPGIRPIRVENLSDGGEITVGANTWKTFPRFRKTAVEDMNDNYDGGSGPLGWAYLKVV